MIDEDEGMDIVYMINPKKERKTKEKRKEKKGGKNIGKRLTSIDRKIFSILVEVSTVNDTRD